MINHLASLLLKFKNLKDPKEERRKIAEIISKELGIEILESQIIFSKNNVTLKVDNYVKTELFMQKEKLLKVLSEANLSIYEIR